MINPSLAPKPKELERPIPFGEVFWALLTSFFPLAILILSVLGAILFGLATPSEAAAVGALGSLLLAAGYRSLTFQRLKEAVYLTARTSAMVCYLFIGSWTFSSVFSYLGGHEVIEHWVLAANLNATGFLILAQFIIFLLGWPLEWTEIIIIFVPIFLPLVKTFHIDPTLFGILVALNIQTSFNTPPMAMAAYYLKGVAPPQVQAEPDFRRRAAVRVHGVPDHDPGLHLPGHRALAAQQALRELMAADAELTTLTAIEAAEQIAGGDMSAEDYIGACLERIAAIDDKVHAFVHLDPEDALTQARALDERRRNGLPIGPLHGVPVAIKDIFDTADYQTECGSPLLKGRQPMRDARRSRGCAPPAR